jgi:large subunit ribosomal protein L4
LEAPVFNIAGEAAGSLELNEKIFGIEPNVAVMHQAVVRQHANARLGTHQTKTRGMVSGGGRKPWRQKGTGRARQGSTRSPQWRGGGVVFGPHPRSYVQAMPRKMRRLAVRSALSVKASENRIIFIEDLAKMEPKTKVALELLRKMNLAGADVLLAIPEPMDNARLSTGNIPTVKLLLAQYLNIADLLKYEYLVMPRESLEVIERILG